MLAAIAVHGVVVLCWILLLIWELPIFSYESPDQEPEPEPEVVVVLHSIAETPKPETIPLPKPKKKTEAETAKKTEAKPPAPLPPKPTPPPMKVAKPEKPKALPEQKRKFARTSEDQAGTPDEPTDLLGERDTLAASELAPTPGTAPNTPSQDGDNPLFPGQVETVTRKYQDGSVGMDKTGEETETPQDETASKKDSPEVEDTPEVETPEPPKPKEKESARPKNKHLEQGEMIPKIDSGEKKTVTQDQPKEKKSPKERSEKTDNEKGKGKAIDQSPKKDGFSGHSRKNKMTGSISRRGKSALNVKNSPLGRYQAKVSKAVELQWRRNCEQHRDHIVPGVISLRFYVDSKGQVSGIKFQEVIEANFIERGFTQRAIRQAKLPKMSKSVIKELDGEPLELIYNFYF